ncbi:MAG: hypothetical protein OCD02_12025 [Spirochaetaceae bacterium]
MKDYDKIVKVKKEIKVINIELNELSAQLGGVFYDTDPVLDDSNLIIEIDELEIIIPQIKKKMETLQGYNLTIAESKENIDVCSDKIKELETHMNSLFEKVGVELYCFIGDKELAYSGIKKIYTELKEAEEKSEKLENTLFSLEKSVTKKSLVERISRPIKIRRIKKDIEQRNRESLYSFKELGRSYSQIPQLIDEETNESLLDVLEEYKTIDSNLRHQKEKQHSLKVRIEENEMKIKEGSEGLKLKILYSKLEQDIVEHQNSIADKLVELGYFIAGKKDFLSENSEVSTKLEIYNQKKTELERKDEELVYFEKKVKLTKMDKEISERKVSISRELEHIAICQEKLSTHEAGLESLKEESNNLKSWLESNSFENEL